MSQVNTKICVILGYCLLIISPKQDEELVIVEHLCLIKFYLIECFLLLKRRRCRVFKNEKLLMQFHVKFSLFHSIPHDLF